MYVSHQMSLLLWVNNLMEGKGTGLLGVFSLMTCLYLLICTLHCFNLYYLFIYLQRQSWVEHCYFWVPNSPVYAWYPDWLKGVDLFIGWGRGLLMLDTPTLSAGRGGTTSWSMYTVYSASVQFSVRSIY